MTHERQRNPVNFVPREYYEAFMKARGKDIKQWPYHLITHADANSPRTGFMVFNLEPLTLNGKQTTSFIITYKALYSKQILKRLVY